MDASASAASPGTVASAGLPFRPADDTALPSGSQWGLALVLCLGLLAVLLSLLKRRHGGQIPWQREAGLLDVVERRSLGPQTQLVVVRYAGRRLLLSVGPTATQCLRDDAEGEGL